MPVNVANWLQSLGLQEYTEIFADNAIDMDVLPDLSEADLEKIGVKLGHRKKLLRSIASLENEQGQPISPEEPFLDADMESTSLAAWQRHPGERKPVTMLFADIVGSTALTENLDAEEAHELLYGAAERMCEAVEKNRGTLCRFMGDGVMAMFGAPVASEHHAVEACEAALEMQRAVHDYVTRTETKGLQIRIGLHSGEVVVMNVGDEGKSEYDASGPTVPIAARMEQAATPGEVYITSATRSLAENRIEAQALEPIRVKGISEPISVFALRRVLSAQETTHDNARTPFVGRRSEVSQFRSMLDSCLDQGLGQTLYIRGEPGIGKTRLVSEFRRIAVAHGVRCHRGLVHPFGVAKGQDALRALVRSLLDIAPGAPDEERGETAGAIMRDGVVDTDLHVHLNDLLDLPQPVELKSLYDAMDRDTRARGQQSVVAQLVTGVSSRDPLLLVVEDIHWADPTTLENLAALTKAASENPVLLIMTSRIEGDPLDQAWRNRAGGGGFTSIELGTLRREESLEIIHSRSTDAPLVEQCLDRAAGNPLFLEQLLSSAEEGAIDGLPDSIHSLVMARLDRLPEQDKQALQCASVIGQRFGSDLLNHVLDADSYDCIELIRHNLVTVDDEQFLFTHALIQEGAYSSLLKRQRQRLHKRCAEYLADSDAVLHAEHLGQANDPGAARAFLKAATAQSDKYRYEHALSLTERGLAMAGEENTLHELTGLKGRLLYELDEVQASLDVFQEMLDQAADDLQRLDAWMGLAAGRGIRDEFDAALELLDLAEPIATRHGRSEQLGRLHHLRGNLYYNEGNIECCHDEHMQALGIARATGSVEDEARSLGGVADAQNARGHMRKAYESFQLCVDRCREIGLGRVEVANSSQMANCFYFLAAGREAQKFSGEILDAIVKVGHQRAEVNAVAGFCNVGLDRGDAELLGAYAERGYGLACRLQSRPWESYYLCQTALAFHLDGDQAKASELAEQAARLSEPSRAFIGGWTLGVLAMVTTDADTRTNALREGDELVAGGMNGEGCLHFIRYALDTCHQEGQWDELERYAAMLESYTRDDPLPWSSFLTARSRTLARIGRGESSDAVIGDVERLIEEARALDYSASVKQLEAAHDRLT